MSEQPPESMDAGSDADLITVLYSEVTLDRVLDLVVAVSAAPVTGADGASVSLVTGTSGQDYRTSNASSPWVRHIDEAQYEDQQGPCVEAIRTGLLVTTDLPDRRWPVFSAAAEDGGVGSVWSHPLLVGGDAIGALNLYSGRSTVPDDDRLLAAGEIARQAGHVLANALSFTTAQQTIDNLRLALENRTTIGQATGILMARQQLTADGAFQVLRRASQRSHRKLVDIAREIVDVAEQAGASGEDA